MLLCCLYGGSERLSDLAGVGQQSRVAVGWAAQSRTLTQASMGASLRPVFGVIADSPVPDVLPGISCLAEHPTHLVSLDFHSVPLQQVLFVLSPFYS